MTATIPVQCTTNLDDYKREEWPKEFCCRPEKGDMVESKSGKRLMIVDITHTRNPNLAWYRDRQPIDFDIPEYVLVIELHKRHSL
jgi:hypothetical protein